MLTVDPLMMENCPKKLRKWVFRGCLYRSTPNHSLLLLYITFICCGAFGSVTRLSSTLEDAGIRKAAESK